MKLSKVSEILKDVWRNWGFALIIGFIFFILITIHIYEMPIFWYYISISIVSGGGVACIIYALIKLFKK